MTKTKRLKKGKHRGMFRRLRTGKRPMSPEQKAINKKARETQRAAALAANEAKKKKSE